MHEHDCAYILQVNHAGRERIQPGLTWRTGLSSTDESEPLNGFPCERMTVAQIEEVVGMYAAGARRRAKPASTGSRSPAPTG